MKLIKWMIFISSCCITSVVLSATYDNLIVFGDSLSDAASLSSEVIPLALKNQGNNTWVKTEGKVGAPITNPDPVLHQNALWPNYLIHDARLFNLNPDGTRRIYPVTQSSQRGYSPLKYSINYAFASAETGDHYTNDLAEGYPYNDAFCKLNGPGQFSPINSCVPGVLLQVKRYVEDVEHHPNPHSLIIIWAGGNDIFNNIAKVASRNEEDNKALLLLKMLNVPFGLSFSSVNNQPLSNGVKNIKAAVTILIQEGVPAQNIYVLNLPDLAQTPAAQHFTHGNQVMLYSMTVITELFNIALRLDLAFNYFNPAFNLPNGHIISINGEFRRILKHYESLGFNKLLANCVEDKATPDCKGYLFFNAKHPTTQAQRHIADYVSRSS